MYDVYLAGVMKPKWRENFKEQISTDLNIFDPYVADFKKNIKNKAEQLAREFYYIDQCNIIVFYFDSSSCKSARLQLGDVIGQSKQVVVFLDGAVKGKKYLKNYCEYRGVILVDSMEELVTTIEEFSAQLELCRADEDSNEQ